jgi:hypothetical protein
VKSVASLGLLAGLVISMRPISAQEAAAFEKIRDISPDKKFAMRVSCSEKPEDPENIDSYLITAIELVTLPKKEVATSLMTEEFYGGFKLVWSSDSKWCAFYSMSGPRVGDTSVYNLRGDKFVGLNTEGLRVDIKGDVRNEYIKPLRWLKPGTLLLEQLAIFRGDEGDATVRFTVRFDAEGKFRVINKTKIPSKE